jgi:hypothetical protein
METASRQDAADVLLDFLYRRGSGSGALLRNAALYCFGETFHYMDVARRLCALGHLEIDWDGEGLTWRAAPPAAFSFRDASGKRHYELTGTFSCEDQAALVEAGCIVESSKIEFLGYYSITRRRVIRTGPTDDRPQILSKTGIPLSSDFGYDLWNRLPPIANLLLGTRSCRVSSALDFFDADARTFVEAHGTSPAYGLFRYRDYARPYYYYRLPHDPPGEFRPVDLSVGLWAVFRHGGQVALIHRSDELIVPRFPPLPVLYERWLHVSGALRQSGLFADREVLIFSPVDDALARQLSQKLGCSLQRK